MKRRCRRVHTPMKNESQKLLWLGAITAAPFAGMCSAPDTCMRKYRRNSGETIPRTSAYSQRETPFSRASRWASSLLTAMEAIRVFGRADRGTDPYMSIIDKITGRAKKAAGDVAGDGSLRAEGRREERKGEEKEKLNDAQDRVEEKAADVADLERRT